MAQDDDAAIRKRALVDLWLKQSELFWKVVLVTPLIEIAVLTAWYNVWKDCDLALAQIALTMGTFVMIVQVFVLGRHAQYLNAFRQAADDLIPRAPAPLFGLSGYRLGVSIPIVICALHVCMLAFLPMPGVCAAVAKQSLASSIQIKPFPSFKTGYWGSKQASTPSRKKNILRTENKWCTLSA